ncbi:MAG: hypothetical protein FWC66_05100 [Oscillospiraceae bacterium]|nr:hypothetical protein [Oscillospiraceae bacterium]
MDKICGILERHERWLETLEPSGEDELKGAHWDAIMHHARLNLEAHELLANNYDLYRKAGIDKIKDERLQSAHAGM